MYIVSQTLNKSLLCFLLAGIFLSTTSCTEDDPGPDEGNPTGERIYTIAMAVGSGSTSTTYVQGLEDFTDGSISFNGFGFEVPSSRTARIFASSDGTSLFDLDYGGGKVYKFDVKGGEKYTQTSETNVEYAIGTTNPRWTKISEEYAMLHHVVTEKIYDETTGEYVKTVATARLMSINLDNLEIGKIEEFQIPESGADAETGDFVFRIDAPIVVGDKVYYGMGKRGYNPSTDENMDPTYTTVETLVVDYPDLTNPRLITTDIAAGATNGYRTPVCHVDENGDIYQIITVRDNTLDTYILRIRDGEYDDSYTYNLSDLLGVNTIANGWFYVGDGIGYVPYANSDEGGTGDPVWAVARVDIYNNTVTKMNLPDNLWLQQYQNSVVIEGKLHMAIAPLGGAGNVYIFDPASDSPDGFTKGATLQTGADAYYIGIY